MCEKVQAYLGLKHCFVVLGILCRQSETGWQYRTSPEAARVANGFGKSKIVTTLQYLHWLSQNKFHPSLSTCILFIHTVLTVIIKSYPQYVFNITTLTLFDVFNNVIMSTELKILHT
jgi:hypothetical protein